MATMQERLQMNRALLDNWNIREQLCLASAVSCSGDQNWMSVSRNLKLVCGNESVNRPSDFFSQKSCALQYANLLENVETPKRKKRTSEESRVGSPVDAITPTDSVLRRLTDERIQELKAEIRRDQEEYAKIYAELQKIQSPQLNDEVLREMWKEIEQEQDAQRIAEMKMENQLREREQKRLELQRSWRLGGTAAVPSPINIKQQQESNSVVDMDVEEIIGVTKSIIPTPQPQQPTATSPLLSSLLKSPTTTVPPPLSTTSSARTNAPTITTLLTSGTIPQTNQPAITLNSNLIPPEQAVQLLTRPISGPPAADSLMAATAQNLLSPSQSAPTLSMLLEKSKTVNTNNQNNTNAPNVSSSEILNTESKREETTMDFEAKKNDSTIEEPVGDADEPDPNEEQQLLEVFKNIGNIDELDIDVSAVINEEVDFLKGVDSPNAADESHNFAAKVEAPNNEETLSGQVNIEKTEIKDVLPKAEATDKEEIVTKAETSSDDSNDNLPLSTVATLEHKDRNLSTPTQIDTNAEKPTNEQNFLKDKVESATIKNIDGVEQEQELQTETPIACENENEAVKIECNISAENAEQQEESFLKNTENEVKIVDNETLSNANTDQHLKPAPEDDDEQMERFLTPTGDEKITEHERLKSEDNKSEFLANIDKENEGSQSNAALVDLGETPDRETHDGNSNIDGNTSTAPLPPPSNASIADTDEDSCTTDISIITKRDEKLGNASNTGSKQGNEKMSSSSQSRKSTQDASSKSTTADDSDSSSTNRVSKRSLLSILSNLSASKSAQTIQRALNEDQLKHNYHKICFRRLDFQSIKKNIENGSIRTAIELQRELLLMTQNVCFLFSCSSSTYKATEVFRHEMQNIREFIFNNNEFETKNEKEVREIKQAAVKQVRTGSRKSLRIA